MGERPVRGEHVAIRATAIQDCPQPREDHDAPALRDATCVARAGIGFRMRAGLRQQRAVGIARPVALATVVASVRGRPGLAADRSRTPSPLFSSRHVFHSPDRSLR